VWYYSIPRARIATHEYIMGMRSRRGASYWGGFDILARRAKNKGPYVKTSDSRLLTTIPQRWLDDLKAEVESKTRSAHFHTAEPSGTNSAAESADPHESTSKHNIKL